MKRYEPLVEALARAARAIGVSDVPEVKLETPRDAAHGDAATNLALALAKALGKKPRQVAEELVRALDLPPGYAKRVEVAGPGFINFFLAEEQLAAVLADVVASGARYGRSDVGHGRTVNVEFVSANPTGPLHVGHGRGAALGDVIARLLEWTGHAVTREFYVNDAGSQIDKLAQSLRARMDRAEVPEGGYHGEYLVELATVANTRAELKGSLPLLRNFAKQAIRKEQEADLEEFGVTFDVWRSEQADLYDAGKVQGTLDRLTDLGVTFEQEGALWLRSTAFGDDKDRVLRKQDGSLTYLAPDIAYHVDKHDRGFETVVDVWGADHHGYIGRVRAALRALGYADAFFNVVLVQLVKVVRGGEEVKMSKRSGEFVTLRELVDEVGIDAARFFFLMRRGDSQFVFDVDLAKRQTDENPVFYVQMAHARMSGIFRVAEREVGSAGTAGVDLSCLTAPEETELLSELAAFPKVVARAAETFEPHRITGYLEGLARIAHAWYHKYRVLGEPEEAARLVLARAVRQVLANGLAILEIRAPDRM